MKEKTINLVLKRCKSLTLWPTENTPMKPGALGSLLICNGQKCPELAPISLINISDKNVLFFINTLSLSRKPVDAQEALVSLTYKNERFTFKGSLLPASQIETSSWWLSRSRQEQLLAWSSNPDHQFFSEATQKKRVERCGNLFSTGEIPRPADWVGYKLQLQNLEYQMYGDDNISLIKNFHHHLHT